MIFLTLFLTFFKIGLFTIGGGYAMIPLIQSEVVDTLKWITENQLLDIFAVSESTPGPFAINTATYVGSLMGGEYGVWGSILGSACATLGVVMPSFIIILIVARFYEKYKQSRIVKGCMSGLKPAAVGLIGAAILSAVGDALLPSGLALSAAVVSPSFYVSVGIFAITVLLAFRKKIHPIWLILLSATLGIAWGYLSPLILK